MAAFICRSGVRWAIVPFALLLLAVATPIDLLDLNDSAIGDPDEPPIVGEQVQVEAVRPRYEEIVGASLSGVSLFSFGSIVLDTARLTPKAVPKPLPIRRSWFLARGHLIRQAIRPSTPTSDPA